MAHAPRLPARRSSHEPHGLRSEGAFARLCGLAPLPTIGISSPWRRSCGEHAFSSAAERYRPLGWPNVAYAGEIALAIVLADPSGELSGLHAAARHYLIALREKVVTSTLWEASFCIDIARKAVGREDTAYVAGCLFRAITLCAHAIHASAGQWLINEKGAVTSAGLLNDAPPGFAPRAHALLGSLGRTEEDLSRSLDRAAALVVKTAAPCFASSGLGRSSGAQ